MALSAMGKFQPTPAYKVSKAALNMLTVQWAESLEKDGFTVLAVCPGVGVSVCPRYANCMLIVHEQWVKTDMGTEAGHLTPEESATGGLNVLFGHTIADSGRFFVVDLPGKEINGEKMYDGSVRPY
jgi:NAD(P)-dependent dehydrogenase (short-subunit alcohol dehydrogenase family)